MTLGDRLYDLIVRGLRMNISTFSTRLGYNSPATISRIVNGKTTSPGADIFQAIKREFANVDLDWLITGEGEMFKDQERTTGTNILSGDESLTMQILQELRTHNEFMKQLVQTQMQTR